MTHDSQDPTCIVPVWQVDFRPMLPEVFAAFARRLPRAWTEAAGWRAEAPDAWSYEPRPVSLASLRWEG